MSTQGLATAQRTRCPSTPWMAGIEPVGVNGLIDHAEPLDERLARSDRSQNRPRPWRDEGEADALRGRGRIGKKDGERAARVRRHAHFPATLSERSRARRILGPHGDPE